MDFNFAAFREPRGVMRVLHFIFSICAFATITGYSGYVLLKCQQSGVTEVKRSFDYPFYLNEENIIIGTDYKNSSTCKASISGDFSSDAKFFVATGVLAMLYALGITLVYIKFDNLYKSNGQLPLIDFALTVIFGVLWLSSSAAWANGLSGLKSVTESVIFNAECKCTSSPSSFSTLNISVIFGFLNFFIWAADLWFLYKETAWFQGSQPQTTSGV